MSVVAFVACAMILVMSAFNGLELLIEDLFSSFDAPITIVAKQGIQIEEKSIPECLHITARAEDDNEIMGVRHKHLDIEGVQFHPESILTEHGHAMLKNFLEAH